MILRSTEDGGLLPAYRYRRVSELPYMSEFTGADRADTEHEQETLPEPGGFAGWQTLKYSP